MNEDSIRTTKRSRIPRCCAARSLVLCGWVVVVTECGSLAFATDFPKAKTSLCRIPPLVDTSTTTTNNNNKPPIVVLLPDGTRKSRLLYELRGGSEQRNRRGNPVRSKFAVDKFAFQNQGPDTSHERKNKNVSKTAAAEVAAAEAEAESIPQTTLPKTTPTEPKTGFSNKSDDPNIEVRKPHEAPRLPYYSPFKMYSSCMAIVSLWILTGTFFYSYTNEWPLPQSFFYAVDAGMSIGFCTDVAETKLTSKAFTIVYIIMGASVVGGALALFIQDIVEGVVERERKNNRLILTKEYELLLGKEAFEQLDVTNDGCLTKDEFGRLLKDTAFRSSSAKDLTDEDIDVLWTKFDRVQDGVIRFEEIEGTYRGIEGLLDSLLNTNTTTTPSIDNAERTSKLQSILSSLSTLVSSLTRSLWTSENRIYYVFLAWVLVGIVWGMLDQKWDPITATHFAISALATGGLTAPPVNSNGILPPEPAIFCGLYCLFGIPLMAITFGHFARALVSDHVAAMEQWALTKPITATHYEIAKKYLVDFRETKTTKDWYSNYPVKSVLRRGSKPSSSSTWRGLRLSDFIVLQIFRQGRISVETINILRKEFELLDRDQTGLLTLEEATNRRDTTSTTSSNEASSVD